MTLRRSPHRPADHALLSLCHALILLLVANCSADTTTAPTPPATAPTTQSATVEVTIKDKVFTLEIADTEAKQALGLMNRASMAADRGMIFIFDTPDTYSFWMKNTLIPLDIIYLDTRGRVVAIHHRKPQDETGMAPDRPALYVIELNAGMSNTIGLKNGDRISLPEKILKRDPASSDKKN